MRLTSLAFADKLPVPSKYTCNGQNTSPPFEFIDVPKGTMSLVFILRDEDSPDNRVHWLVYNIQGTVSHLDEGKIPDDAVAGTGTDGSRAYTGPCPKYFRGIHRFRFTLFALDSLLDVGFGATADEVIQSMASHVLDSAELVGIVEGELI